MFYVVFSIPFIIVGIITYFISDGNLAITLLGTIFGTPLILIVISLIYTNTDKAKKEKEDAKKGLEEKINNIFKEEKVEISQQYRTFNYSVVGIDEKNHKVCFLDSSSKLDLKKVDYYGAITNNIEYKVRTVNYQDILEAELIIDGETITKTSRSSQVGGALLGSVLAGGVGAIIGGLSGKTSSKEQVMTIQLKIIINDTKNPLKIIPFLNETTSIKKEDEKYLKAYEEAMHWLSIFKVIIDKADKEDKSKVQSNKINDNKTTTSNIADEIRKLHDLLKEGIITQEEFDSQKKKIIS